jgi:cellulose synthase (UDP-forming)
MSVTIAATIADVVDQPGPPTASERYAYLRRPQHRWMFGFGLVAFLGVAASLAGFATRSPWASILLVPVALMVVEQAFAVRTSTFRRSADLTSHLDLVRSWRPASHPSVDVFVPTCGEDLGILAATLLHAARMSWPGRLVVHVLDDAARPEVAELAERLGARYLARSGSAYKKAGNLQYAFERTAGEHIVILDADFVPSHDFLEHLVPYLDDASVGIVQSPQYFRATRDMTWLERAAGTTQELFFRFIQPSRDAVGAAICVGTSAVYRRAALEAIGGFPLIGHSEDVVTGVEMTRAGYRLRYVPVIVSQGRCPSDLDSFIAQQYRWCEGSMSLLADPHFHDDPSMTAAQRASFWSGFLYYVSTAMLAVLAPLPILAMLWVFPDAIAATHAVPLLGTIALWLVVFPAVHHTPWRLEVLRVQLVYGFAHLFAILDLHRGKAVEWVPTFHGSARSPLAHRVRRLMVPYLAATQILILVGMGRAVAAHGIGDLWAVAALAVIQAYVTVPVVAAGARTWLSTRRPRRAAHRAARTRVAR